MADELVNIPADPNEGDSTAGDEHSLLSTSSLSSSIREYRTIHGRTFQNADYWSPNDDKQNEGLDIAHHFLSLIIDSKLFLAPIGENPQRVLDVGTGTGIWAIDFADSYPSAEVTGTDISPIQPSWVPPNLKFEIDDAQLDWTWPEDYFDFVHVRNIYGGISDWLDLYKKAYKHVKPGGWYEDVEIDIRVRGDVPKDHIFNKWSDIFEECGEKMGKSFKISQGSRMKDLMAEAGFVDIVEKEYICPVGTWPADPQMKKIGAYVYIYVHDSLEGFALYMLTQVMGWEYVEAQAFIAQARTEMKNPKNHQYFKVKFVYGRKPGAPAVAA